MAKNLIQEGIQVVKRILFMALFTLVSISLLGQDLAEAKENLIIESPITFTEDDGLPANSIRDLVLTREGFLWMATAKGLTRFDGLDFEVFSHDSKDSTSILDDRISALFIDSTHLYIGSQLGFSIMDLKKETFENFQFKNFELCDTFDIRVITRVMCIEDDSNGDIWFGTFTDGIFKYSKEDKTFKNYRFPISEMGDGFPIKSNIDHILSLSKDRFDAEIMWAGTTAGLLRINIKSEKIEWFLHAVGEEDMLVSQNAVRSIYHHQNGLIYYPTWHAGVIVFDPRISEFKPLSIKNGSGTLRNQATDFLNSTISDIIQKSKTEIWIKSYSGIMTYNTADQKASEFHFNNTKQNKIFSIHELDREGRAWGYSGHGLSLLDNVQQQFVGNNFKDLKGTYEFCRDIFIEPVSGDIGFFPGYSEYIYFLNRKNRIWRKIKIPSKFYKFKDVFGGQDIKRAPDGNWTIASMSGLYTFDAQRESIEPIKLPKELGTDQIRGILWDSRGTLWLGTKANGMTNWNPRTNEWKIYYDELRNPYNSNIFSGINDFFEDVNHNIWIKHSEGYSIYDTKKDTLYHHILRDNKEAPFIRVKNFTSLNDGTIVINGYFGEIGLAHPDSCASGISKVVTVKDNGKEVSIAHLTADSKGNLWGVDAENLVKIDPIDFEMHKYSFKYGLRSDHGLYALFITPEDKLIIGGVNQIWFADPDKFDRNSEVPSPYIKQIKVLQKEYKSDVATHLIRDLDLRYEENFFSFDFSSIGFTRSNENVFKYRLKGFKDEWTEVKERRYANYTNVPPGDYTFELQVANNEGTWNPEFATVNVHVATPWWLSIWFWSLVAIGLAGLTYMAYVWRIRQVRKEEKLKADFQRKLTEMEMSALRAQMNPHFIFNAMNSIDYYIISNEQEKASDYLNRFSRLIRLILQNSKSTVVPLKDDLEALQLYIDIENMRFDDVFEYEILLEEEVDTELIEIPPMILQPYVENAIWHGLKQKKNGKGRLGVKIRRSEKSIVCVIEDNGIGREAAEKLKSKSGDRRKSFGMKITKGRLEALNQIANTNASVQIFDLNKEDKSASGTRVEIVIPI